MRSSPTLPGRLQRHDDGFIQRLDVLRGVIGFGDEHFFAVFVLQLDHRHGIGIDLAEDEFHLGLLIVRGAQHHLDRLVQRIAAAHRDDFVVVVRVGLRVQMAQAVTVRQVIVQTRSGGDLQSAFGHGRERLIAQKGHVR